MHLVPTQDEVIELLRQTGALRGGHFECLNGLHTDKYLDVALALRCYRNQKTLSVGLSRRLREHPEIRAAIPELSIVTVTPAGLPIAWGLCEALCARQVYWAEKEKRDLPMRFRQFLEQAPGERVVLVDDVLRAGRLLSQARELIESRGAEVMAVAVIVHQPTPQTISLDPLPVYCLARLDATYYSEPAECELCRQGIPLERQCVDMGIGV
jgi:orotate phosphoribosyltransferase